MFGLFSLPVSLLHSVLVGCMFLESCPFLLGCWICWHLIVHSILLWLFCGCCDFFSFIYCLGFLSLSLFFFFSFLLCGMWDLSSLTRDGTCAPCIGRQSLSYWTAGEVPSFFFSSNWSNMFMSCFIYSSE